MNIKKGDMVSIKQDFIDRNNRYEYDSRDMGNLGEGCLISAFIWLIIMLAIIGVFCLY